MQLEILRAHPPRATDRPTLLFVHGMWHAAWCWEPHFLRYFAQAGYPAQALSLPGHGGSAATRPMVRQTVGDYVAAVVHAARQIDGPVVLVGHSMGGFMVQRALEQFPAAGAILLASVPHTGVLGTTLGFAMAHPWAFAQINLRLSMYPAVATPELAHAYLFSDDMPAEMVEEYQARLQDDSWWAYVQMFFLALPRPSRAHRCPMLVLAAEQDRLVPQPALRRTAKVFGADFDTLPGLAHDVMLEPRWEHAAKRMERWLTDHT